MATKNGIDVSKWQGTIDWAKVKATGKVDFAILRAGYGKLASQKDPKFEEYYTGATAQNIPVGVYWYSYAKTANEAKQEAEACYQCIKGKKFEYITQLGTGNYNEKTSKIYTDLSYITSRQDIGEDAVKFFQNMSLDNLNGHYEKLIVSPTSFKSSIISKIHEEIEKAKNGKNACIIMKMNSLTDRELIDLLKKASKAGVKVNLIIRGICCILPGIPDITENIRVISIVGRFLEHSRIYCFGEDDDRAIYLSSADLMTRNTEKRVEIGFPIEDAKLKKRIIKMVELMLSDNVKAREIDSNGVYNKIAYTGEPISSQDIFMTNQFYEKVPEAKKESFIEKLKNLFK